MKKVAIVLAIIAVIFVALLTILTIDGRAYERWKCASVLRDMHRSWVRKGSPMPPPNPINYIRVSRGTSYVHTVTHTIEGQPYGGLFAFRASYYDW